MNNKLVKLLCAVSILAISANSCEADGVSGSASVTNNYVARGTAQTYSDIPSYMINVNYDYKGFYVGAFTANVDFGEDQIQTQSNPTYQEIDFWLGYRKPVDKLLFAFMFGTYNYLGDTFTPLDMMELKLAITVPVVDKLNFTGSVGWTPDYFNILGQSVWVEGNLVYIVNDKVSLSTGVGRQFIPNQGGSDVMPYMEDGYSYTTWNVGVTYTFNSNWSLDLRYADTDRPELGEVFERNPYGMNVSATIKFSF